MGKIELLKRWERAWALLEEQSIKLNDMGLSPDSDLLNAMWHCFTEYTELVAQQIGDDNEWLMWYWLENDFGDGDSVASIGDSGTKKINNLEELLAFIEYENEQ